MHTGFAVVIADAFVNAQPSTLPQIALNAHPNMFEYLSDE